MNNNPQTQKRHDLRNFIITFVLIFFGLISFVWWYAYGQGVSIEQPNMNKYLNEKYGQEFVVENIHQAGGGIGDKSSWVLDAYPKSDPSLRFEIRKSQRTGQIDYDTFPQAVWKKQEAVPLEKDLKAIFGFVPKYSLTVKGGDIKSMHGYPPSWTEVVNSKDNKTSYDLSTTTDTPLSITTLKEHETKARELSALVSARHTTSFSVDYNITSKKILSSQYRYYISNGAAPHDISCEEYFSISDKNYVEAMASATLEPYFGKSCSYSSNSGSSGGGVTAFTYPGSTPKRNYTEVDLP